MLLPYTGLTYFGSATGAMVDTAPVIGVEASIKADVTGAASVQGGQIEPYIKGTMALKQTLSVQAIGELHLALPKKLATTALSVSIGATPSAYDIAQAVWGQVASAVNETGTTGAKLNSAGGAADPWADPKALTVGKFIALK